MLQKRSFSFRSLRPVYVTLTGLSFLLTLMGSRCEASRSGTLDTSQKAVIDSFPYDLANPAKKILLEDEALHEISGIGFTGIPGIISAIADEKGEVFMLDLNNNGKITDRILFREKGDFEGIEIVGDTIYAIQSNAKLSEIINWKNNPNPEIHVYENPLPEESDIEGLGYDAQKNILLIACKEDPEVSKARNIWGFDLKTKQLTDKPVYVLNPDQVDQWVPSQEEDKSRHFSTSGIAVHPQTGDIYLVSSALKRLAVIDGKSGALKAAFRLDRQLLLQPEGIAFDKNGDLYISSEGKKQQGYILKFEKRAAAQN